MEQLLISNAVDQSLGRIDFTPLAGRTVFLDTTLIDCVDKNYIIASTRSRIFQAGGRLVDEKEKAEIAVELRSGAVGTNQSEMFVGMPAIAVPGPLPIAIPEVKLWSRSTQTGTAKLGLVAYETDSREVIGTGGTILARSDDSNTFFMGMGPWQSGSVRKEVKRQLGRSEWYPLPNTVAFSMPGDVNEPARLRIAGSDSSPVNEHSGPGVDNAVSPASMDASAQPIVPPAPVPATSGSAGKP